MKRFFIRPSIASALILFTFGHLNALQASAALGTRADYKLPERKRPSLSEVLKEPGARRVLDKQGHVLSSGSHIDPAPSYLVQLPDGTYEKKTWSPGVSPSDLGMAGASTLTFSPALPSDIGNVQDLSSSLLYTTGTDSQRSQDVIQWSFADCWLLAPIASIAIEHPELRSTLLQRDVLAGSGHYQVNLKDNSGNSMIVKVNGQLGDLAARPNPSSGAIWVPLVEKAMAFARYQISSGSSPNTYASLNWGYTGDAFRALGFGVLAVSTYSNDLITIIRSGLANQQPMAGITGQVSDGSGIISAHAYAIYDADSIAKTITIVNPWGTGGPNNDGYQVITLAQFRTNFLSLNITNSIPAVIAQDLKPGDANGDGIVDLADYDIWFKNVGVSNPSGPTQGDFDSSGVVDLADYDIWFKNVGL